MKQDNYWSAFAKTGRVEDYFAILRRGYLRKRRGCRIPAPSTGGATALCV